MSLKRRLLCRILGLLPAFLGAVVLAANTPAADEWVLAAGNHPPWFYADGPTVEGIAYDALSEVALKLGYKTKPHMMPTKRIYAELLKGRAHFSVVLVHDETIAYPPGLLMGQERLLGYPVVGVALKSRSLKVDTLEQLTNFQIGNLMMPEQVDPYIREGFTSTPYLTTSHLLKGLISNRIDIAITATPNFLEAAKRLGILDDLEIVYTLGYDSMYLGFSKKSLGEQAELEVHRADEALMELKETGRLAEIISRYSDVNHFIDYGESVP